MKLVKEGLPLFRLDAPRGSRFSWFHRALCREETPLLSSFISRDDLTRILHRHGVSFGQQAGAIYTPMVVLWGMISQVIHQGHQRSCRAAVERILCVVNALDGGVHSANTGAYCRARKQLGFEAIRQIAIAVAASAVDDHRCLAEAPTGPGRTIYADGYTVRAMDTAKNQAKYPQNPRQKRGLGFPIIRIVSLFDAATGVHLDAAMGPYQGVGTGETALLRSLLPALKKGDTLVADRYYCTYWVMAACLQRGVNVVLRKHHRRKQKSHGKREHTETWRKPPRPSWMSRREYEQVAESLTVREVPIHQTRRGYRTKKLTVVTTHLDRRSHPSRVIQEVYRRRWDVEQDIRAIKQSLGMDFIHAKTPDRVHAEIWTCLLAYNLIRESMLQAATRTGRRCRSLSFTASLSELATTWVVHVLVPPTYLHQEQAIRSRTSDRVGHRPNRIEPRALKERTQIYPLLTVPRDEARAKLMSLG